MSNNAATSKGVLIWAASMSAASTSCSPVALMCHRHPWAKAPAVNYFDASTAAHKDQDKMNAVTHASATRHQWPSNSTTAPSRAFKRTALTSRARANNSSAAKRFKHASTTASCSVKAHVGPPSRVFSSASQWMQNVRTPVSTRRTKKRVGFSQTYSIVSTKPVVPM